VIALFLIAVFVVKKVLGTREARHMDAADAEAAARESEPPLRGAE
jgi:membrane-associated protein